MTQHSKDYREAFRILSRETDVTEYGSDGELGEVSLEDTPEGVVVRSGYNSPDSHDLSAECVEAAAAVLAAEGFTGFLDLEADIPVFAANLETGDAIQAVIDAHNAQARALREGTA